MVAARDTPSADVQLTDHAHRQRVEVHVQYVQAAAADALTNRRIHRLAMAVGGDFPQQRRDHGFRRPIAVDQELRLECVLDPLEGGVRHRVATEAIDAHRRRVAALQFGVFGQLQQIGRREAGDADALAVQHRQGLLGGPQIVVADHQGRAADQRGDPAFMGAIEGERHEMQLAIVRVHLV
ncbi:hypothetical protein D3C75_877000 [compost metagenome]